MKKKGIFIVFEGIDGSGKSTQIQLLAERFRQEGISFYTTMEPTDSPIGSLIRQIMTGKMKADDRVTAALFAADRLDHLLNESSGVKKKIDEGTSVIMDRYYFSSYAYQGVEAPMEWVMQVNALSSGILRPTVNLFLDVDPDTALERIKKSRTQIELYEKKSRLVQVRKRYLEAFEKLRDSEHIAVIDAGRSLSETADEIWKNVSGYFC